MPINPSDLLLSQIDENDFKEFIHGESSMRTDTMTVDSADLQMTFQIPGDKLKAAIQWVLGVNYVGESDSKLHRTLPMFHPVYPWAWAKSIQIHGQGPDGDDTDAVIWMWQTTPSKWQKYSVVVAFDYPSFPLWYDDEVTYEYERFLSKEMTPSVKIVSVDNGQMIYNLPSGDTALGHGQAHVGLVPVARREGAGLKMRWHQVPLEFVQEDEDSLPTKLLQAQGKLNSDTIFGATAGTLLCNEIKIAKKYVAPIATDTANELYWMYDIDFEFEYLKQLDSEIADGVSETRRGHNLVLGPRQKWRWAQNSTTGLPTYSSVAFAKLFTIWSDAF